MPIQLGSQIRRVVNWVLLCCNILLFIFLAWRSVPHSDRLMGKAQNDASKTGMAVYSVKDPFILLANKNFPQKDSFFLFVDGTPLYIRGGDIVEDEAKAIEDQTNSQAKKVAIGLGTDFEVSCRYSVLEKAPWVKVSELWLTRKNETLIDLNADGTYDERFLLGKATPPPCEVWYQGAWQECDGDGEWSEFQRTLKNGEKVRFDAKDGVWRSATETSSASNNL